MKSWACAAIVALSGWASAQHANPRYEFNWRLRELERAWAKHTSPEERAKALPRIEDAVQLQSSGDLVAAAEAIDDARTKLEGELADDFGVPVDEYGDFESLRKRDSMGRAITPVKRLCDKSELNVALVTESFYGKRDERGGWLCGVCDADLIKARERAVHPTLALDDLAQADQTVQFRLADPDVGDVQRSIVISVVNNRDARLAALEKAIAHLGSSAPRLEVDSATESLALLKPLAAGASNASDYPAARLLAETEQVVAAAAKGDAWYGPQHPGEFWLAMSWLGTSASEVTSAHLRVLVPSGLTREKPRPLVLALHGEGGDENSMFECGDGVLARMCEQRNWILVAPRLIAGKRCDFEHMLAQLAETFPFDFTRVFLLGYSSGALSGLGFFEKTPGWVNGFAAIGGGRGAHADKLASRNVFCAAGERDFGRFGAERLHQSLIAAGSQVATLKIYPNCEHLMVVTDALPDVFAWFDKLAQ